MDKRLKMNRFGLDSGSGRRWWSGTGSKKHAPPGASRGPDLSAYRSGAFGLDDPVRAVCGHVVRRTGFHSEPDREREYVDRKTVLVVDDHESSRSAYAALLERAGYRVLEAENGADGIRFARERRPAAILMDIGMPIMDGLEASEMLKRDPETAHIPILAISAQTLVRQQEQMRAVCDGFLSKPCNPHQILEEVQKLVDERQEPSTR
jgi:two-component system cell cycle response regulator DivK